MAIPISSLQEYPGVWTIRARVNQKSDILHWNETTYYFTIDLHDSTVSDLFVTYKLSIVQLCDRMHDVHACCRSALPVPYQGSIRAMLVNEVADKFFPVFMENKVGAVGSAMVVM